MGDTGEIKIQKQEIKDSNVSMIGQQTIYSAEKESPKLVLPKYPPAIRNLIGREEALFDFKDKLDNNKIVLVTGIGGIGKTEFVKKFLEQVSLEDRKIGWFDYNVSFRDTILNTRGLVENANAFLQDQEAIYLERFSLIKKLEKNDILVFDNIDNKNIEPILELECKVIITTRCIFEQYKKTFFNYSLDFLSLKACRELFLFYWEKEIETKEEEEYLDKIIELTVNHTLSLELLAKTCRAGYLSVKELYEKLHSEGFSLQSIKERIKRNNYSDDKVFIEHMTKLYEIPKEKLSEIEIHVLKNLCVIPLIDFDIKVLKEWLGLDSFDVLNHLNEKGWIKIENATVTMHRVIAEILKYKLSPCYKDCKGLIEKVLKSIDYDINDIRIYTAPYLQHADNIANIFKENKLILANLNEIIGVIRRMQGKYREELAYHKKVLKTRKEILGINHPQIATSCNNIGTAYYNMGKYEIALKYFSEALEIRKKVLGETHVETATSYSNIGTVYSDMGKYETALKYFDTALKIRKELLKEIHIDIAVTYNNIGYTYNKMGKYKTALEYHERVLKIYKKILEETHPDIALTYNNIGSVYNNMGKKETALQYYKTALKIREKILIKTHPEIATSYNNIGNVYNDIGKYKEALEYYKIALKIRKESLGDNHINVAQSYNNIGNVYSSIGEYKEAIKYYETAIKIWEEDLGKNHLETALGYSNIGITYNDMGEYKKAYEFCNKAFSVAEEVLGEEHPNTNMIYNNMLLTKKVMEKQENE